MSDSNAKMRLAHEGAIMKAAAMSKLFDKLNPELITYLGDPEIEKIAILQALIDDENKARKTLNMQESNIYDDVIYHFEVLRCSRYGFRSEQGVRILNTKTDTDENQNKTLNVNGQVQK